MDGCVEDCTELTPVIEKLEIVDKELVYTTTFEGVDYPLATTNLGQTILDCVCAGCGLVKDADNCLSVDCNIFPAFNAASLRVDDAIDTTGAAGTELPAFDSWGHTENLANPVTPAALCDDWVWKIEVDYRGVIARSPGSVLNPLGSDNGRDLRTNLYVNGDTLGCGDASVGSIDTWVSADHPTSNGMVNKGHGFWDANPPGVANAIDMRNVIGHRTGESNLGTWSWIGSVQWRFVLAKTV